MSHAPRLLWRMFVVVCWGCSKTLVGQSAALEYQEDRLPIASPLDQKILQGKIRSEYLLQSIRKNYCALRLYDPSGFELKSKNQATSIALEELNVFFNGYSQALNFISDSSSYLPQQALSWIWLPPQTTLPENSWNIVCYYTSSTAFEAQEYLHQQLKLLQKQHLEIPIQLIFIQQDL